MHIATRDSTEKEAAPSITDESEDQEDVEGNWSNFGGLTPDPELKPKGSDDGKPGPVEASKCL